MANNSFFTNVENWINTIDGIESIVYVGDWEDILNLQLGGLATPVAVIELPDLIPIDEENNWEYEAAISILKPLITHDYSEALLKSTMSDTLTLTKSLTDYMMDCEDGEVNTISNIHPITKATAESLYGWRFLFRMMYE
jgi:hypothetical protein